jgi:GWxTD domain-containing protein
MPSALLRPVTRLVLAALLLAGCAGKREVGAPTPSGRQATPGDAPTNPVELYRTMGLLSAGGGMPFVSRVAFLPDAPGDTTLTLFAISLAPRAIGFAREGDQYAGSYAVRLEVRQGPRLLETIERTETVRVATFRETSRTDDAIVFQQFLRLAPGTYTVSLVVRDPFTVRASSAEATVRVPSLDEGRLASLVPVRQAVPRSAPDSLPRLLAQPRATVVFGRDSILPVYLEAAGTRTATRVRLTVRGEGNTELWRDSTVLLGRGGDLVSGLVSVPVAGLGVGVVLLEASREGEVVDTVRTALLVSLGDDLPVADFDEVIDYLRWFATTERLRALRESRGAERAAEWSAFLAATDPYPGTPEHEGLRDYFARIRTANERFRDDGPVGWRTDRGTAYVALGDPDNVFDSGITDPSRQQRQQVWEYRRWRLQLVFIDRSGYGRWRLPTNEAAELQSAIRRKLADEARR